MNLELELISAKNLEELLQIEAIKINAGNVSFIMHANEYSVENVAGHHYSVKLDNLYIAEFESDNVVVDAPDEFKELASVEESKFSANFGSFVLSATKPSNKNVEIILREDCELLDNDFKICFAW
jgi:hypothetical protein